MGRGRGLKSFLRNIRSCLIKALWEYSFSLSFFFLCIYFFFGGGGGGGVGGWGVGGGG